MLTRINRQQLAEKTLSGRAVIVEALPEKYYTDRHLPGALHLPHDQVDALAPQLLSDKTAEIVVYCASASCQNSHIAAQHLLRLGYTNVAVYAEGKQDWIDAGLPTMSGPMLRRAA